jgi:SAM-dependent methyltransferase
MPYGPDLALVHDEGHADLARRAARFVARALRARGLRSGLVVDLGCGSGVAAEALTRAGYDVLGVDLSPAMLSIARRRAPRAAFRRGSAFRVAIPSCVAVTAMGEVLGYAFDRASGTKALARVFRRAREALDPRGLLVFDALSPDAVPDPPRRVWREGRGWGVGAVVSGDARGRAIVRRITTFRRVGGRWRRRAEIHRVLLHRPAMLVALLRRAGFAARTLAGYDRATRHPGAFVVVASPRGGRREPRAG